MGSGSRFGRIRADMDIILANRTAETAAIYFERTNHETFRKVLPQQARSVEEAVADFEKSQLPGAASFGRTIRADGVYIGDVWCYGIDPDGTPNAMVSYCIFEAAYWELGIATQALALFLGEIVPKFGLETVGAFTYADNFPSIRVLETNGFRLVEEFTEDGVLSRYYQLDLEQEKA